MILGVFDVFIILFYEKIIIKLFLICRDDYTIIHYCLLFDIDIIY